MLREELHHLQEPGSYCGEVIKQMGQKKVLVKINPEGKYVVDIDKDIDINDLKPNTRVALKNDSYTIHKILILIRRGSTAQIAVGGGMLRFAGLPLWIAC